MIFYKFNGVLIETPIIQLNNSLKKEKHMTNIKRYTAADTNDLFNEIKRINNTLSPFSIGLFDPFLNENNSCNPFNLAKNATNYPPYNIKRKGDEYIIEIAVAGFSREAIAIEYKDRTLTIKGEQKGSKEEGVEYLHNGLAGRSFTRSFGLADTVEITSATLVDGILTVNCKQLIPEHLKPKTIEIMCGPANEEVSTSEPQLLCED